tara:strand:+ start:3652 stop:4572 length:921 start_codon:yes stop_codon:yes gene_type:complete
MVVKMNEYEAEIKSMKEYTYQWLPENYTDPTEPILKITKSSLGTFDWCPKKYDFSYQQRLPQDQTEAMRKGTIMHNAREDFFNEFDIVKAETMNDDELLDYCSSLFPVDDYFEEYQTIAVFESQRFMEALKEGKTDEYLPVCNEGKFDCEILIPSDANPKFPLSRDYVVHLQGIIDRIFKEGNGYIPMEFKTGPWKDYKASGMRKEMAFYKLLIENSSESVLNNAGLEPNVPVTHWSWYYPISNYIFCEEATNAYRKNNVKKVIQNIAKLIHSYEQKLFETKFYYKTCAHCSFFGLCDAAEENTWL